MTKLFKLLNNTDIRVRLAIFAMGFSPIASLSLSTFNLIPLHISGPGIVLPAILLTFALGFMMPQYKRTLIQGWVLGVIAVFLYDSICRFVFMYVGIWKDFIPKIGNYLLNREHVHWTVGYLWRYIGNGGGMGMAFYAMYPLVRDRIKPVKAGILYGIAIFCCLLITVYCSPSGTTYLFNPTVLSAYLGLMGHVVYGYVLGHGARLFPDRAAVASVHHVLAPSTLHPDPIWEVNGSLSGQVAGAMESAELEVLVK